MKKKYGITLGRSRCRFVVSTVDRGDLQSFQFSRGGWSAAVKFARQTGKGPFMGLLDIVCGRFPNRMPLMQCGTTGHCEPELFTAAEGHGSPIAGLGSGRCRG